MTEREVLELFKAIVRAARNTIGPVLPAMEAEIDRRIAAMDAGENATDPVRAELAVRCEQVEQLQQDLDTYCVALGPGVARHEILLEIKRLKIALEAERSHNETHDARTRDAALEEAARVCDQYAAENDEIADRARGSAVALDISIRRRATAVEFRGASRAIRSLKSTNTAKPPAPVAQPDEQSRATPAGGTTCVRCGHDAYSHHGDDGPCLTDYGNGRHCPCPALQAQAASTAGEGKESSGEARDADSAAHNAARSVSPTVAAPSPALPDQGVKACPFCGCTRSTARPDDEQAGKWGSMVCDECGAVGPEVRTGYEKPDKWRPAAIEEWSRRSSPSVEQVVEAVRKVPCYTANSVYLGDLESAIRAAFSRSGP